MLHGSTILEVRAAPRSAQDTLQRLLESFFFAFKNGLKFGLVLGPILVDFGHQNRIQKMLDQYVFCVFWAVQKCCSF